MLEEFYRHFNRTVIGFTVEISLIFLYFCEVVMYNLLKELYFQMYQILSFLTDV